MTDNEIIKALECCSKNSILQEYCDVCPNLAMGSKCMDNMVRDALGLINRQKAEIERLSKFLDMTRKVSLTRRDQNIRKDELMIKMSAELKTAKAEAIKECIEKVKEKLDDVSRVEFEGAYYYLVGKAFFDNLLEEMEGENNENL